MPISGRRTGDHGQKRKQHPGQPDGEIHLARDAGEITRVQRDERAREDDPQHHQRRSGDEESPQQVVGQTPRVVFAVEREPLRECGHERRAHGAFSEQIADEVRDAERHDEGVHVVACAKDGGEDLIPEQAQNPADECRGACQASRVGEEGRTRYGQAPPRCLRTSSFTVLPSTFCPASFAITAFMTRPMSLGDVAPVSAMAAATAASTVAESAAAGR